MKTYIKNVAVLDMRNATPERVDQIERIDNVALILASTETAPLVARMNIGNMATVVEIPDGAELLMYNGNHTLSTVQGKKVFLLVNGNLVVSDRDTAQEISTAVCGGMINGNVLGNEGQISALAASGVMINGNSNTYPDEARLRESRAPFTAFEAKGADTPLYLTRRVVIEAGASAVLAAGGLSLYGKRGAIIPAADAEAFFKVWRGEGNVLQVPDGFVLVEGTQDIRRAKAPLLRGKRYIVGDLILHEDVDMDSLRALSALAVTGKLFLPESLLAPMLDILQTEPELIPYTGTLMRPDGELTLTPDAVPAGRVALCVDGVITLSPDLTPEKLREAFSMVYLEGVLRMTQAQRAALLPVLLGDGEVEIRSENEAPEDEEEDACPEGCIVIANAAQFIL